MLVAASRTQDPGLSLRNMEAAKYPDYSLASLDNITISAQVKGDVLPMLEEIRNTNTNIIAAADLVGILPLRGEGRGGGGDTSGYKYKWLSSKKSIIFFNFWFFTIIPQ